MTEQETWKWQETGTAWRGVGIYHVTLVVPSRESFYWEGLSFLRVIQNRQWWKGLRWGIDLLMS